MKTARSVTVIREYLMPDGTIKTEADITPAEKEALAIRILKAVVYLDSLRREKGVNST